MTSKWPGNCQLPVATQSPKEAGGKNATAYGVSK
jgi:hypothetical protein